MKWGKKILFPALTPHVLPFQGIPYKLQRLSKRQQAPHFLLKCQGFSFRLNRQHPQSVLALTQLRQTRNIPALGSQMLCATELDN